MPPIGAKSEASLWPLRVRLEARELFLEKQIHDSGRTISLLADDHLGLSLERVAVLVHRTVVEFLPVQEHDQVGVLLDGARFTKVGQLRPLVVAGALLRRARELRQ